MANNKDTIKACLAATILLGSLVITGTLDRQAAAPPTGSCANVQLGVGTTYLCTDSSPTVQLASDGCDGGQQFAQELTREVAQFTGKATTMVCGPTTYSSAP